MSTLEFCKEIDERLSDTSKETLKPLGLWNHYRRLTTYINKEGESVTPSKKAIEDLAKLAGLTYKTVKVTKFVVNI